MENNFKKWKNQDTLNARDYVYERDTIVDAITAAETDVTSVTEDLATHEARVDNPHQVTKTQVGLGNVDNTSDLNKPISTATQTALDNILDGTTPHTRIHLQDVSTSAEIYFVDGDETDNGSDTVYIDLPSGTTIEVGKLDLNDVRNANGAAFVKGQVLAITGVQGDEMTGIHADPTNTTDFIQYKTFGVVNNGFDVNEVGDVITRGVITNIPAANFAVAPTAPGQFLWVVSGGELSTTPPAKPAIQHLMGLALKVHGSLVDIFVYDRFFQKLSDSSDVSISSIVDNDILVYNASTGVWENSQDLVLDGNLIEIGADGNQLILKNAQTHGDITDVGVKLLAGNENIVIDPQGINKTTIIGNLNTTGDLNLGGDLFINGNTVQVNFDRVETRDDTLTLRSEATGALGAGAYSGLIAKLADGTNDSGLLFNGNGVARVGDITVVDGEITSTANTQALATREDSPTDGGFAVWNATANRFDTTVPEISDVDGLQTALDGKVNLPETEVNNGVGYWDSANNRFNTSSTLIAVDSVNGDIQGRFWRGQGVYNNLGSFNSYVNTATTGTTISRNIADANPALVVNQANASSTGNIVEFDFQGNLAARIDRSGNLITGGYVQAGKFSDFSNGNYFLDPASTGTSLAVAGNVGIGITSPAAPLEVKQTSDSITGGLILIDTAGGYTGRAFVYNGSFILGQGANSQLALSSSGNVGIGTTSPSAKLDVVGQTKITSASYPPLQVTRTSTSTSGMLGALNLIHATTSNMGDGFGTSLVFSVIDNSSSANTLSAIESKRSGADNSGILSFVTSNFGTSTEKMTILPDGNVGIGTTTPTERLDVTGNAKVSGDTNTGTLTLGSFTLEYNEATQSLNFNFSE